MIEAIRKDDKVVEVLSASAKGERLDSLVRENADKVVKELAQDMSPNNRYLMSQLLAYTVNEVLKDGIDFLASIADVKNVGLGDKAQFKAKLDHVRAFVQAKGATTPRSRIANKAITLDTVAISARPAIDTVQLVTGSVDMADLIRDAAYQMKLAELGLVKDTLTAAYANNAFAAPYYGAGSGIVTATLNPLIRHWMRYGGAAVLGDIEVTAKLAEQTGFAANTTDKQFSGNLIDEFHNNGFVGRYIGSSVGVLPNAYGDDHVTTLLPEKMLFIFPTGVSGDTRPLKFVREGGIQSMETTNIDDKTYEVRLDQYAAAGFVYGDQPYMSVYQDTSN